MSVCPDQGHSPVAVWLKGEAHSPTNRQFTKGGLVKGGLAIINDNNINNIDINND